MLAEPVSDGYGRADCTPNQETLAAACQSSDEHAAAGAQSDFSEILGIVAIAFELAFLVYVGAALGVCVHQRGIEHEAVSIGEDQVFGEDGDGGPADDSARLARLGDAALDSGTDRDHGFAVQ